jgi:hypothetical protein
MKATPPAARPTLAALAAGRTTSRKLVEDCLFRISHPDGEGKRVFVKVYDVAARIAAEAQDGSNVMDLPLQNGFDEPEWKVFQIC